VGKFLKPQFQSILIGTVQILASELWIVLRYCLKEMYMVAISLLPRTLQANSVKEYRKCAFACDHWCL